MKEILIANLQTNVRRVHLGIARTCLQNARHCLPSVGATLRDVANGQRETRQLNETLCLPQSDVKAGGFVRLSVATTE